MLVVRDAAVDEAMVGSTILNFRNVLFEMPLDSPVTVSFQENDEVFQDIATYQDALALCKKYANMYSSMIKLSAELDTDQKIILHVPTDPSLMKQADEALRALDLITDISLTKEPQDYLLESSDAGSMSSEDQVVILKDGVLSELTEYKSRTSHTHV